eukprot:Skav218627  [mRNA]  locus=scaffold365:75237:84958:+ [translate_table: standard]
MDAANSFLDATEERADLNQHFGKATSRLGSESVTLWKRLVAQRYSIYVNYHSDRLAKLNPEIDEEDWQARAERHQLALGGAGSDLAELAELGVVPALSAKCSAALPTEQPAVCRCKDFCSGPSRRHHEAVLAAMVKGACHPNGSNFQRVARLDARTVRSPYPQMVWHPGAKMCQEVLLFALRWCQDCYVDGNDWSAGNDAYRDDHPVMQAQRRDGAGGRYQAFEETERIFTKRRQDLEIEQKLMMAMAVKAVAEGFQPMFSTGRAYLEARDLTAMDGAGAQWGH